MNNIILLHFETILCNISKENDNFCAYVLFQMRVPFTHFGWFVMPLCILSIPWLSSVLLPAPLIAVLVKRDMYFESLEAACIKRSTLPVFVQLTFKLRK